MNGWRTVVIERPMHLSERDGRLILFDTELKTERVVPLAQLREIIVFQKKTTISTGLMATAALQGIEIIVCDKKYLPCCVSLPLEQHVNAAGLLMDQAKWDEERKKAVWAEIVREKIKMQCLLLAEVGQTTPSEMLQLYEGIRPGDPYNCEGQAAKLYFQLLFGRNFQRRTESNINAGLNYGYSILLSCLSRIIVSHGYSCALGVHHCSRENSLNLACDLMEPFRPFVDQIVYFAGGVELDMPYRRKLIEVLHGGCLYNRMSTVIETATEAYALDLFKAMQDDTHKMGEIEFER